MPKVYLSDGAYAELQEDGLHITAENGIEATDRVVLDDAGLIALLAYLCSFDGGKRYVQTALERAS